MVPIIFKPFFFFFCGPDPLPDTLICDLSHWIPLFSLIVVVPITYKPFFFCGPTHPSRHPYLTPIPLAFPCHPDRSDIYHLSIFFSVDPLPIPGTPTFHMANTRTQELQA
jgi:hypothetical protein